MPSTESQNRTLELLYRELQQQSDIFDRLDGKAGVILGFALVALAQILSGVLRFQSGSLGIRQGWLFLFWLFFVAALLALLNTVFWGLKSLVPSCFSVPSILEDAKKDPLDDELEILKSFIPVLAECVADNEKVNENKSTYTRRAVIFLALAAFLLAILSTLLLVEITSKLSP